MDTTHAKRIVNLMKQANKPNPAKSTGLVWGKVDSINPLVIMVDNRFPVYEEFLILSALCQEQIIKIPTETIVKHLHIVPLHTTDSALDGVHPHTHMVQPFNTVEAMPQIRLWRGLEKGDNVRMLRINEGQTYYVMEREEGIPWYETSAIADNK